MKSRRSEVTPASSQENGGAELWIYAAICRELMKLRGGVCVSTTGGESIVNTLEGFYHSVLEMLCSSTQFIKKKKLSGLLVKPCADSHPAAAGEERLRVFCYSRLEKKLTRETLEKLQLMWWQQWQQRWLFTFGSAPIIICSPN